jgi:large subunit ribosomal protein L19
MAIQTTHKDTQFGVGDVIKISQRIKEGEKERTQAFEGMVISIKGREENKSFTVRKIGSQQVGIERIFPLLSPTIEKIEVVRKGMSGIRRAKLFYTRNKSKREIEKIYSRANERNRAKAAKK